MLFFAALLGGALNAVAGGGSFITFPTLLFTGVAAIPANATNTVALWTGLTFSGGAFRRHLKVGRAVLISLVSVSVAGGVLGALLLLRTPAHTFLKILPWLMLIATLLFIFGGRLTPAGTAASQELRRHDPGLKAILAASCFQLLVAIYGGYFGGGMGFVILAMLAAFGMADIHEMNALEDRPERLDQRRGGDCVHPEARRVLAAGAGDDLRCCARWILRSALFPAPAACLGARFVIAVGVGMTAYFFVRGH